MTHEEFIEKLRQIEWDSIKAWCRLQTALDKVNEIQLALPEHKEL
jgi:hypothetical protein